jgi:N-acetylneuraminic acid mutarotase
MKNFLPFIVFCMVFSLPAVTCGQDAESCDFHYGTYKDLTPMPVKVNSMASGLIDGKIYLTGGYDVDTQYTFPDDVRMRDHISVYDPVTDTWDTTGTPLPVNRCIYGGGDMVLNGKLYVIGGIEWVYQSGEWLAVPFARVDVYDPLSDSWELKSNLPVPIGSSSVCRLDGKLYVTGGSTNEGVLKTLYSYDPATDQWTELAEMIDERMVHISVAIDNKIYVIGGLKSFGPAINSCEVYDPAEDQWSSIAPLPRNIATAGGCAVDGEIYIFGGTSVANETRLRTVYRYNPGEDSWSRLDDCPPLSEQVVLAIGRTIYSFGGRSAGEHVEETVFSYTPSEVRLDAMIPDDTISGDAIVVDLSEYFSHVNEGEITYSFCLDEPDVVEASIDGSMLTVTGLMAGDAEVSVLAESGEDNMGDAFMVHVVPVGIDEMCEIPPALHIYPNPAHGLTTLAYSVQSPGQVRLEIYDMLGKRVTIQLNKFKVPGEYEIPFDTGGFEPGIYLCNLTTASERITVKLMVEY